MQRSLFCPTAVSAPLPKASLPPIRAKEFDWESVSLVWNRGAVDFAAVSAAPCGRVPTPCCCYAATGHRRSSAAGPWRAYCWKRAHGPVQRGLSCRHSSPGPLDCRPGGRSSYGSPRSAIGGDSLTLEHAAVLVCPRTQCSSPPAGTSGHPCPPALWPCA